MTMLVIDDGTGKPDWARRAKLVVLLGLMAGSTKKQTLAQIKDNAKFAVMVAKEWDRQRRLRLKRKKEKGNA